MEETHMSWRKSSYSNGGANACVEVGTSIDRVAVRDTTDHDTNRHRRDFEGHGS